MLRLEREVVCHTPPPIIIAISQYVARQFREHYGLSDDRIRIVFNGVDPDSADDADRAHDRADIRRQYELAKGERLALCVAHNFRLKGVARLIEATAHLAPDARDRLRILIVGRDDPAPYLRLAERLGVSRRIVFAGSTQRIAAFYHAADLLIHPTFYDPCSRVVLEALSAGVPVITTRFNGAAEVMTDGREGFVLADPDDVSALAGRIATLLDDSARQACAEAARQLRGRIGMDRHATDVLKIYQEICEARSCRPRS